MRSALLMILCTWAAGLHAGSEYRVLVVGDSWSEFMWIDGSLRTEFAARGRADVWEKGDVTAISGSTAEEWATAPFLQLITDELNANPGIHLVQLTVGGNDFLAGESGGGWFLTMTPEEEEALLDRVAGYTLTIIQHIQNLDPDVEIVLSHYDYPNFVDSLLFCGGTWDDLGNPTPEEINLALTRFIDRAQEVVSGLSGVFLVRHLGQMQFHFGHPDQGVPPGQLPPPGDPTLTSPRQAMRFGGLDCIHINSEGNSVIAGNLWDQFYSSKLCLTNAMFQQLLPDWPLETTILDLVDGLERICL